MNYKELTITELLNHRKAKVEQLNYYNRYNGPKFNFDLNNILSVILELDAEISSRRNNKIKNILK